MALVAMTGLGGLVKADPEDIEQSVYKRHLDKAMKTGDVDMSSIEVEPVLMGITNMYSVWICRIKGFCALLFEHLGFGTCLGALHFGYLAALM